MLCLAIIVFTRVNVFKIIGLNFSILQWYCIIIILISILYRTIVDNSDYLRLLQVLTGIIISIITAVIASDYKYRKWLLYTILISASASGITALLQFMGKANWTWERTFYYGFSQKMPSGLETYPVAYSYSVLGVLIICGSLGLYQLMNTKPNQMRIGSPAIMLPATGLILLGLFVSGSRSGMLGVITGALAVWSLFKFTHIKFIPLSYLLPLILIIPMMYWLTDWGIFEFFKDKMSNVESDERIEGSWQLFMPIIFDYPLGVPAEIYNARDYYGGSISKAYSAFGGYDPHNVFLTSAIFYGVFASLALFIFYIVTLGQTYLGIKRFSRKAYKEDSILLILTMGAIIALITHSWFHNASIILGEMRGWIWFGFSQGLLNNMRRTAR